MVTPTIWKQTLKQDGLPVLQLHIRRPELLGDSRSTGRIDRYYRQLAQQWQTHWQSDVFPRACQAAQEAQKASQPFQPWQVNLDYAVTYETQELLSIYVESTLSTGHPHQLAVRTACTWSCKTGTPLPLQHFYPLKKMGRRTLLRQLEEQVQQRIQGGESLLDANCPTRMAALFDRNHYYLSEGMIQIFYPLYAMAPYAEGIPVFCVPWPQEATT